MRKIFTLFIIGLSVNMYAQTNLLSNADFESGDAGWTNSGAVSRTIVTPGYNSTQAFEVVGEVNKGAQYKDGVTAVTVDAYEVSFWAKGTVGEIAKLKVKFTDNSSVLVSGTFSETDQWEFFKHTYEQTDVKTIDKYILQCGSGTTAATMTFVADDLFYGVSASGVDPVDPVDPDYSTFPYIEDFESGDYTIGGEIAKKNDTDGENDFWNGGTHPLFDRYWRGNFTTEYLTSVDADASSGSKAMKLMVNTMEGENFRLRSVNIPAGDYTITFKAKTDAAGVGKAKLGFSEDPAGWMSLTETYTEYSGGSTVVVNPNNGTTRLIVFYTCDPNVVGTQTYNIWIDDIEIKEGLPTNINQAAKANVIIYPNPMQTELMVQTDAHIKKLEVYSLTGQKVLADYSGRKQINVASLSKGVYIVSLVADGQVIRKKVTKE